MLPPAPIPAGGRVMVADQRNVPAVVVSGHLEERGLGGIGCTPTAEGYSPGAERDV